MKRIVSFDVGTHTVGIAQSDILQTFAHPLKTLRFQEHDWEKLWIELEQLINFKEVSTCVIGLPFHMNHTTGDSAKRSERFADFLQEHIDDKIKIAYFDERLTSIQAEKILIHADMSRKKRKKVIDTVAAVLILEGYLQANHR